MTIKPDKTWIRGLSAAGVVVAAAIALTGCSLINQVTGGGTTEDGTQTSAFSIKVGDCLNDGDLTGEVETVPVVACTEPHDSEAYASIILNGATFPGADVVDQEAQDGCLEAFEPYVGKSYDTSQYEVSYYYPTEATWANGDREILCVIYDPAGKSTGSAKGSGL